MVCSLSHSSHLRLLFYFIFEESKCKNQMNEKTKRMIVLCYLLSVSNQGYDLLSDSHLRLLFYLFLKKERSRSNSTNRKQHSILGWNTAPLVLAAWAFKV